MTNDYLFYKIDTVKLEVPQKYIPLVALYRLSEGLPNPYHLEDIAIESKKISPNSFSWTKYKEHIDLRQVMRSLDILKKEGLITGKNTTAWTLSTSGIEVTKGFGLDIVSDIKSPERNRGIYSAELERIMSSEAYAIWLVDKRVDESSALKLLRLDQYSSENQKLANMTKFELASKHTEVEEFVNELIKFLRKEGSV